MECQNRHAAGNPPIAERLTEFLCLAVFYHPGSPVSTSFFPIYQYPLLKFFHLQEINCLAVYENHAIIICVSAELLFSSPLYGPVAQLGERTVRIHMDLHHLPDFSFQFSVRFFGLSPQN